ncbi:MAG TPA: UDP-glucose 4-epimerase GalE [Mycobacteriales bacterium]|jgi:UDP-glucose 4-epimerase|nr:UDP-glucose 4-epimerase GalE [Mycobacteriales bacterium]
MTWMLTGGAGYIGAHIVRAFDAAGLPVVVLDDLSTGIRENVPADVPFVQASVGDSEAVRAALREHGVTGVLHLAAKKSVAESVEKPLLYWDENVGGMRSLLQSCVDEGVDRILFSSSAAVFGNPPVDFVTEETPVAPMSPYGETKLIGEWMLRDLAAATGLRWAALRYFNVAGTGAPELADRSVTNLVPMTFRALTAGRNPQLFGDDYDTRDGSCIRDYIHVVDLAEAHAAAAARLDEAPIGEVFNVGRGEGVTVTEVFATVREVTGIDFTVDVVGRRAGDPAAYFADATKIGKELGWTARLDLADMVRSAWEAWQQRG